MGVLAHKTYFELLPINNVEEAATILPNTPLGSLIPMASVVEGFHNTITSDATELSGLHHHLQVFLQNITGDGENGCISRNDGILVPLQRLVGCTSYGRDVHYHSTPGESRPDFTGLYNSVQLVVAEEKDDNIKAAVDDIVKKFRFVYNYAEPIRIMFGFAISRNDFVILRFERNSMDPLPRSHSVWFSSTLSSVRDRVMCIQAALNVGRVFKYYRLSFLLNPSPIALGTWIIRAQSDKHIKICSDYVIVRSFQPKPRRRQMRNFYLATSEVVNLEHLYLGKNHPDGFRDGMVNGSAYLDIYLRPLGRTVLPASPVQLKRAFLCVLQCIKQLHALGYLHTDIRWFNVVLVGNDSWVLIDCYDFCEATDRDELVKIKTRRTAGTVVGTEWCAADDLGQVISLAHAEQFLGDEYQMFAALRALAGSVGETSVDDIIRIVEQVNL